MLLVNSLSGILYPLKILSVYYIDGIIDGFFYEKNNDVSFHISQIMFLFSPNFIYEVFSVNKTIFILISLLTIKNKELNTM
jgi:hypothetical protein